MNMTICRSAIFSVLLQFLAFFQLHPADANATTDYFIFPRTNAEGIYCSELQIKNSRIHCSTNGILMEFDQKDINMVEVIHNGRSLKISHFDKNTMDRIKALVSTAPDPSSKNNTTNLITTLHVPSFAEWAVVFQKTLSLETNFGKTTTALLLLGMAVFATGSLMYAVAAFRTSMLWGLGCIFIPFVPVIFLFAHWKAARKPFVISILGLFTATAALFLIKGGGQKNFQCRGKIYCSEMTSCAEAKFYLRNCPGVKIDGDYDGIPCEKQWCN